MTEYRRFRLPGATWFFTVNLAERSGNRRLVEYIDVLRAAFRRTLATRPFRIDAVVVLPKPYRMCRRRRRIDRVFQPSTEGERPR